MADSWTSCDCCLSRDDVCAVEGFLQGDYLCRRCREGRCEKCGSR